MGGKAIPAKLNKCMGYLSGNLVYSVFAPSGIPSPQSIQPLIDQVDGLLSKAGCESSAESLMSVSSIGSASISMASVGYGVALTLSMLFAAYVLKGGARSDTLQEALLA